MWTHLAGGTRVDVLLAAAGLASNGHLSGDVSRLDPLPPVAVRLTCRVRHGPCPTRDRTRRDVEGRATAGGPAHGQQGRRLTARHLLFSRRTRTAGKEPGDRTRRGWDPLRMQGSGGPDGGEPHGPRPGYVDHGTKKADDPTVRGAQAPGPDTGARTPAVRRARSPVTVDPRASPGRRALARTADAAQSLAPDGRLPFDGGPPLQAVPAVLLGLFLVAVAAGAPGPAVVLFLLLAAAAAGATLWTRTWTEGVRVRHDDLPDSDRLLLADLDRTFRARELSARRCGELRQARDPGDEADTRWEVATLLREAHEKEAPPADGGELPNNIKRVVEGARGQARRIVLEEQEATREVDGLRADIEEAPENVPAAVARLAERTERLAARLDSPAERSRTYAEAVRAAMKDLKERFPRPDPPPTPPGARPDGAG